jgi:hypothetical protein
VKKEQKGRKFIVMPVKEEKEEEAAFHNTEKQVYRALPTANRRIITVMGV